MPIVVDAVSVPNYLAFLDSFNENTNNVTPFLFNTYLLKHPSLNYEYFNIINLSNVIALSSIKKNVQKISKTSIISNNKDKCISIWVKFMVSLLGYKQLNKIQHYMYNKLTPYQFSVVIGLLLSDVSLSKGNNKNARLQFKQSLNKFFDFFCQFLIVCSLTVAVCP